MISKKFFIAVATLLIAVLAVAQIKIADPATPKISAPPLFTNPVIVPANPPSSNLESPRLSENTPLSPGVYLTKPFAMKLKVPGPQPDDIMAHRPGEPWPPAQILRPKIETVPASTNSVKK